MHRRTVIVDREVQQALDLRRRALGVDDQVLG